MMTKIANELQIELDQQAGQITNSHTKVQNFHRRLIALLYKPIGRSNLHSELVQLN